MVEICTIDVLSRLEVECTSSKAMKVSSSTSLRYVFCDCVCMTVRGTFTGEDYKRKSKSDSKEDDYFTRNFT